LERIIVVKVFSHQLDKDFMVKRPEKNQVQIYSLCQQISMQIMRLIRLENLFRTLMAAMIKFYPPFSPHWCFSFEAYIINKGTAKLLNDKIDDELSYRLQHWQKQGLFYRLLPNIGVRTEQIGKESLLRNIVKLIAPCWTHCSYRYAPLVNQIWRHWRAALQENARLDTPENIPKGWQKIQRIANNIIKACPFCERNKNNSAMRIGNMEHLHIYCTAPILTDTRAHCHKKMKRQFTTYIITPIIKNSSYHYMKNFE
jgi:hypothetical protein